MIEQKGQEAARTAAQLQEDVQALQRIVSMLGVINAAQPVEAVMPPIAPAGRTTRPALPAPQLIRKILRNRQERGRFFDAQLFADPAWDMLLDLAAARAEYQRVSVTSLCIASGVPPTTALRWIGQMVDQGWFVRVGDQTDRRRAFIDLSDRGNDAMAGYFAATGTSDYR